MVYSFLVHLLFVITRILNIKQRGAVFQLVLDDDTHSFEADVVLLDSIVESLRKTIKGLIRALKDS